MAALENRRGEKRHEGQTDLGCQLSPGTPTLTLSKWSLTVTHFTRTCSKVTLKASACFKLTSLNV